MTARVLSAVAAALLAGALAAPGAGGGSAGWPDRVQGSPGTIDRQTPLGYYLWHDGNGWHVRWTTGGRLRRFSGTITGDERLHNLARIRVEPGADQIALRGAGTQITFEASARGFVDGFDFTTGGSVLTFDLLLDGARIGRGLVFLGAQRVTPNQVPFTVRRDHWPDAVQGSPGAITGAAPPGYYLWHDGDGWHVRWTTGGATRRFSGTVTTDGRFQDLRRVRTEAQDRVALSEDRTQIAFDARTANAVDGFDFTTGGSVLTFDLLLDGRRAERARVFLGPGRATPGQVPFAIRRVVS